MGTAERPDKPAGTSPTQLAIKVTERSAPRSASLLARFGLPGRVQHAQIDLILSEARKLDAELQAKDAMARLVAALYRQAGSAALSQGQPLPPAPPTQTNSARAHGHADSALRRPSIGSWTRRHGAARCVPGL